MVGNAIFKSYLAQIEQAYKAGNATEHTHRPALKTLLEAFEPGVRATNEPKRIKCGAPDYIITRKDIPLGFVEAKDIGVSLDVTEKSEQLKRYFDGLAKSQANGKLRIETEGIQQLTECSSPFSLRISPLSPAPRNSPCVWRGWRD